MIMFDEHLYSVYIIDYADETKLLVGPPGDVNVS